MPIADISELLLELGLHSTVAEADRALAQQALVKAEGAVKRYLQYDPAQASRTEFYPNMELSRSAREGIWEVNDTQAYVRQAAEAATSELQLRHIPIRGDITTLNIDYDGRAGTRSGAFASGTAKVQGTDFWPNYDGLDSAGVKFCRDGVLRSEGLWPVTPGTVKVVYTAGYTQDELRGQDTVLDASPIWESVIEEAVARFVKAKQKMKRRAGWTGPLTSERLGDYSYSADASLLASLVGGADLQQACIDRLNDFVNYGLALAG